jgi:hypothetical protein
LPLRVIDSLRIVESEICEEERRSNLERHLIVWALISISKYFLGVS